MLIRVVLTRMVNRLESTTREVYDVKDLQEAYTLLMNRPDWETIQSFEIKQLDDLASGTTAAPVLPCAKDADG